MRKLFIRLTFFLVVLLIGCYPLATGSMKWRISWDKEMKRGKKEFLAQNDSLKKRPPNVVVILADDLGKFEVSAYGAKHIATPHIDQLGKEGAVFTRAYCSAPVCAPSRAGIMTGRYQQRFGYETQEMQVYPTNIIEYLSGKYLANTGDFVMRSRPVYPREWHIHKQGVPPTEITMSELFKHYGYSTALFGKWHLGHSKQHVPEVRGFDHTYGFLGHSSLYTPEQSTPGYVSHIQDQFSAKYQWDTKRDDHAAIRENGKEIIEEDYLTWAIRDRGINWMNEHKDDPFFMMYSFSAPHVPFQAPIDYYCKWDTDLLGNKLDDNHQTYYALINALDDAVGDINQAIKDAGLEENTIVWFLSDNGGASYTGATENGPLKGGKMTHFEGGINIPMMVKWPGHFPRGQRYTKPVTSLDIYVSSAKAAGMALPDDRVYDGVNLFPHLRSEVDSFPHPFVFLRSDHIKTMIKEDWKMVLSTRDEWQHLYNLARDSSEMMECMEQNPELFEQMWQRHQQWQKELPKKPMWPRVMDMKFKLEDGNEYLFPA